MDVISHLMSMPYTMSYTLSLYCYLLKFKSNTIREILQKILKADIGVSYKLQIERLLYTRDGCIWTLFKVC